MKCPNCDEEMEPFDHEDEWTTVWRCFNCGYKEERM